MCRSQLKKRDEDFAGLQSVHDAVKGQLEQQNGDLSHKLAKVLVRLRKCEGLFKRTMSISRFNTVQISMLLS